MARCPRQSEVPWTCRVGAWQDPGLSHLDAGCVGREVGEKSVRAAPGTAVAGPATGLHDDSFVNAKTTWLPAGGAPEGTQQVLLKAGHRGAHLWHHDWTASRGP